MIFEITQIFWLSFIYLSVLFGIAWCTDRGWIPSSFVRHPVVYVLSLGVFTSAFAFFGIVGLASEYGFSYLTYYFGVAGFFMFGPLFLLPLQKVCQEYQLASLADLLTFRFRSQWAGALVTVFVGIGMLPLLALQIQAVADTAFILTQTDSTQPVPYGPHFGLAFIFCLAITLFTMMYGAGHISYRKRHNGLVAAIAFETVVKGCAFLAIGLAAVFGIFGGPSEMQAWLETNPVRLSQVNTVNQGDQSGRTLLLITFAAAVAAPHMFHMMFSEKPTRKALTVAVWGVPLLLLLLSLPVLPILWAGLASDSSLVPEYFTLGIGLELESEIFTSLAFICGLSAASGVIIVSTLAMASMCLNHLILPFYQPNIERDIYRWLIWVRRVIIVWIILSGYVFYRMFATSGQLAPLGVSAFSALLQFLPGIFAVLYGPNINRNGLIAGLCGGFITWFFTLFLPVLTDFWVEIPGITPGNVWLLDTWATSVMLSFGINVFLLIVVSRLTTTSNDERSAAVLCSLDNLSRPQRKTLSIGSAFDMREALATALGETVAAREMSRALENLEFQLDETRPYALRRLRDQLEANLSGLLGTTVALEMVNRLFPYSGDAPTGRGEDIQLVETRLEGLQENFTGLVAELDSLRLVHRRTLMELPIGVCILGQDHEITLWNNAMENMSGISANYITGALVERLPAPWNQLLLDFSQDDKSQHKQEVELNDGLRWLTLHKTFSQTEETGSDTVILVEDITESQLLEDELIHSERLASVGRLAAGVAHEIGNPVTGIASLAQNLKAESSDPELKEVAMDIVTQTERITSIVQTLVNFSHGGVHMEGQRNEAVSVYDCAAEAIKLLSLDKDATEINFSNQCNPTHHIVGDPQRFIQVCLNLLSNARDASLPGQPVRIYSASHGSDQLAITVEDHGRGIPQEQMDQLFEPFFTTKEPGQGTGLGLALVYSIVEDHGGEISVQSSTMAPDNGTRFTLHMPMADPEVR